MKLSFSYGKENINCIQFDINKILYQESVEEILLFTI